MIQVSKNIFDQVVEWIREANNYVGIGRHDPDGTSHYLSVDGQNKHAARHTWDDFTGKEIWLVDEKLYQQWRKKFGYTINF